jgi:hypothetical protein
MGADRLILTLARGQPGAVASRQLTAARVSRYVVARRVSAGWLVRRYRGVYLVGPLRTQLTEPMAAVLALGDGALLSHYPAAVLRGLRPPAPGPMQVTVIGRDARGPGEIEVHRHDTHAGDRTTRRGIPVTSPARTLFDLATQLSRRDLDRAADEARVHRLVTDHSLNEQFRRYPHHRGITALTKAIQIEPALTRSEAERRLLELIRAAGLPEPEVNAQSAATRSTSSGEATTWSSRSTATPSTHRATRSSATGGGTRNSRPPTTVCHLAADHGRARDAGRHPRPRPTPVAPPPAPPPGTRTPRARPRARRASAAPRPARRPPCAGAARASAVGASARVA